MASRSPARRASGRGWPRPRYNRPGVGVGAAKARIYRLTWDGHDLLGAVRSDSIWSKAKERLEDTAISAPLQVPKLVTVALMLTAAMGLLVRLASVSTDAFRRRRASRDRLVGRGLRMRRFDGRRLRSGRGERGRVWLHPTMH